MTTAAPHSPSSGRPHPPIRPLVRSGTDRMAGGVCGGLGEYTGIDATLWRAAAVLFTVVGGAGVVVYLLLWVLLPSAPLPEGTLPSPLEQGLDRLRSALLGRRSGEGR